MYEPPDVYLNSGYPFVCARYSLLLSVIEL